MCQQYPVYSNAAKSSTVYFVLLTSFLILSAKTARQELSSHCITAMAGFYKEMQLLGLGLDVRLGGQADSSFPSLTICPAISSPFI